MLVAEPVLHEVDIELRKKGWVENSSAAIDKMAATTTPKSRQRYA